MVRALSQSYDDPKTPSAEVSDWLGLEENILARGEQIPAALWICKHLEPLTIDPRKRHLMDVNDVDRILVFRNAECKPSALSTIIFVSVFVSFVGVSWPALASPW